MPLPDTPVTNDIRGQLVFLGTGTSVGVPIIGCNCPVCTSGDPRNRRLRCAVVLGLSEGNLLIDTPPDLRTQLLREQIGLVHAVVYTHDHVDHVYGLDDLRVFPHYLDRPLPIYCEEQVERRIRSSFDYAFAEEVANYPRGWLPQLDLRPIADGEPFRVLGTNVVPFRLLHGRFKVLGFRVGDVAYCTDTNNIPDESWQYLAGLDVLILDCLRHKPHAAHFGLEQAVEVAGRVGAKRTLLTHLSHDLDHEATEQSLPQGIGLAYDGLRIPLTP